MDKPKVYIETTLFNFYFAEKSKQYFGNTVKYCHETKLFFEAVKAGKFEPYTSVYTVNEIKRESNEDRQSEMLKLITDYNIEVLPGGEKVEKLAGLYVEAGALSKTFLTDAFHIAATAIHGLDFIVSLNFQHIVKNKTLQVTAQVNETEGYKAVGIYEPGEVIDNDGN